NWLFARRAGGTFILRIEDTDLARSSEEMVRAILDGLGWLGLTHDEGPFFQSTFRDQHVQMARALLECGRAYRCVCTMDEIDRRKSVVEASGRVWKYDRKCLQDPGAPGLPHCVRFLVPEGETVYDDLVHGVTRFDNADIEDLVLLRTDGTPT